MYVPVLCFLSFPISPCFHSSSMRPTRHYTVFLSEDSSGDELQHEDHSGSGFPDNLFFSVPFEWSPVYAQSLISFTFHLIGLFN